MAAKTYSCISLLCRSPAYQLRTKVRASPSRPNQTVAARVHKPSTFSSANSLSPHSCLMSSVQNSGPALACPPRTKTPWQLPLALLFMLACTACDSGERNRPGDFDYYVLVLGWSPAYCNMEGRERGDDQCEAGRERAFTLHGLWPQYERGWPKNCRLSHRPFVPESVINHINNII